MVTEFPGIPVMISKKANKMIPTAIHCCRDHDISPVLPCHFCHCLQSSPQELIFLLHIILEILPTDIGWDRVVNGRDKSALLDQGY